MKSEKTITEDPTMEDLFEEQLMQELRENYVNKGEIQVNTPDCVNEPLMSDMNIFLAGTIDNGASTNWQKHVITAFRKVLYTPFISTTFHNPRVESWDPQASSEAQMRQIQWELKYLTSADIVLVNILEDSKSPITLMELGLLVGRNDTRKAVLVCCPPGFYRYDNVKAICELGGLLLYNTEFEMMLALYKIVNKHNENVILNAPK